MSYPDLPSGKDLPRRNFQKAPGKIWSNYIFGRRLNIAHLQKYGFVTVSAYHSRRGICYTDPVKSETRPKNSRVICRYTVRLKQKV